MEPLFHIEKDKIDEKKAFVRCDFDVPFDGVGGITSTLRIDRCIPTIKFLLDYKCGVVLATKLGRPEKEMLSTLLIKDYLSQALGIKVEYVEDYPGTRAHDAIKNVHFGSALLLENVRSYDVEKNRDDDFAAEFVKDFDLYVNEAFAVCHRDETSVTTIPRYLSPYAGINLEKEIDTLSKVMQNPDRPLTLIVGGAKIESKLPVIEEFLDKADNILIGGKVGKENPTMFADSENVFVATTDDTGFDISEVSIAAFQEKITLSKTVIFAGPMGKFENPNYEKGTKAIAQSIVDSGVYSVAGGGDTIAALDRFYLTNKFSFVSTGGGAMLEFLAGNKLPGLEALG